MKEQRHDTNMSLNNGSDIQKERHLGQFSSLSSSKPIYETLTKKKLIKLSFAPCMGRNQCAIILDKIAIPIMLIILNSITDIL